MGVECVLQVCKYVWVCVCVCRQSQVGEVEAEGGTEDKVRRRGGEVEQMKASNIKRRGFLSLCGPASLQLTVVEIQGYVQFS